MTSAKHQDDSAPIISFSITALSFAALASAISQRVTDPLLLRLASEFNVGLGDVSWVITCFTLGYALNQLLFGPIGDRFGKYWVIACACIASGAAALLCALARDLSLLLVARTLAGAMTAAIIPLAMAWIGDVIPYEQRQPILARFLIGQILGVSTGQLLGGLAADYLGWRTPFFILSLLFVAVGVMLFSMRRRLPSHAIQTLHGEGHALQRMWREFGTVLSLRWARVILITVFLEGAFMFGAFAFLPSHLYRTLGVPLTAAGAIVMPFGFGGFLFAAGSRQLVSRLGEIGLARWGARIILLSLLGIAFIPAIWLAAFACFTMGLGFYMLHNTLQTNATQMAPERRGAAVSAFALCYFLGQSAGIAAAGLVVERTGTRALIVTGALGLFAIALCFVAEKRRHSPHD